MRLITSTFAIALTASTITTDVSAAPVINLPSIVGQIIGNTGKSIESILKSVGVTVSTDAGKHGPYWSFNVDIKPNRGNGWKPKKHDVNWRKPFSGWNTYKANGVNLGSWLEVEQSNTPGVIPAQYPDEWTYCATEGKAVCGPVLERHYSTWYTTADIDKFAAYGINTLRIPTHYAVWLEVPGSQLYTGNQKQHLKTITDYAIRKGMHVVIGLHSLPGGVNWLDIGEAFTHLDWWYNATNLDYSLQTIDKVLDFVQASPNPSQFTISPINEGCDDFSKFATPETVSYPNGVNYMNSYLKAAYAKIQKRNKKISMMVADNFMGAKYWAPFWNKGDNIVFDSHFYFFAAAGVYGNLVSEITCGQAEAAKTDFPIFVGEFSLQSKFNNSLANRQEVYQSQVYSYATHLAGSAFWNGKMTSQAKVDGEGVQQDYWSFMDLIDAGVINPGGVINASYC